ncbi:MAG: DUF1045 domain-containing protein [Bradyrhizobium sp.]|nr:DUF1045 domain-containing protein [Bradyrhizobium sp.]
MSPSSRYAIYFAPARGSKLDRFGAQLLGWDAWTGKVLPFPQGILQNVPDWRELTAAPRKYGFHATLKAPFALAQGRTADELRAACAAFADRPRSFPVFRPMVDTIGGFIAVVPMARSDELERLAGDCVTVFDGFRAPLTEEDRARRNPDELSFRQRDYLERWGYPYVMEEFRFHMTLTARLAATRQEVVLNMLRDWFSAAAIERLVIDRIALFRQHDATSRFEIFGQWPLRAMASEF